MLLLLLLAVGMMEPFRGQVVGQDVLEGVDTPVDVSLFGNVGIPLLIIKS